MKLYRDLQSPEFIHSLAEAFNIPTGSYRVVPLYYSKADSYGNLNLYKPWGDNQ